jgi:hypothetical protein
VNYKRLLLAAIASFIAYFVIGTLFFAVFGRDAFRPYAAVYRPMPEIQHYLPLGMAATLLAMFVLAVMYAKGYEGGGRVAEGARFGVLVAIFFDCVFVVHNYVNLNISLQLTLQQAVAYSCEWLISSIVIALVYAPLPGHQRRSS